MDLTDDIDTLSRNLDPKYEKYLSTLRQPAKRAKLALINALQKSEVTFKKQVHNVEPEEQKRRFLKKLERISNELEILKNLQEDDIVSFALTSQLKLMAVAANPRLPKMMRIKARVASHKPLSSRLIMIKKKLNESRESEEEEEPLQEDSKTLDKITFNKYIILMRKNVKRAKIYIIHKLTRQLGKLRKSKKVDEKTKAKLERKTKRLVKIIQHIKGLLVDDVSRYALSSSEDFKKLSVDVQAPTKTQAMATIAIHKFVAAPVTEFKNKFPDWKKVVPSLLKKKKKKRKLDVANKENKKSGIKTSDTKSKEDKNISNNNHLNSASEEGESEEDRSEEEGSEEGESEEEGSEKEGSEEEASVDGEQSDEEGSDVTENSEGTCIQEEKNKNEKFVVLGKGNNMDNYNLTDKKMLSSSEGGSCDNVKSSSKSNIGPKKHKNIGKDVTRVQDKEQNKNKKTTLKSKSSIKSDHDWGTSKNNPKSKLIEIKPKPKVVDPFFVTASNEEYVTTQVPVETKKGSTLKGKSSNSGKLESFSQFDNKRKWDCQESDWKKSKLGSHEILPDKKPYINNSEKFSKTFSSNKNLNIFANRKERRKALQEPVKELKREKLHPSWEAKKKLSSIANFQGKKIVFD